MNADARQRVVHRPLRGSGRARHLGLETIQKRGDIEPLGTASHAPGRQAPARPRRPRVVIVHPRLAERLAIRVVLDDVGVEPVGELREVGVAHHPVEIVARQLLRLEHEKGQQARLEVAGLPQRDRERVIPLDRRGDLSDPAHRHAELLVARAVLRVAGAHLLVAERLQLRERVFHRHDCAASFAGRRIS
jgi:hypothetical protein